MPREDTQFKKGHKQFATGRTYFKKGHKSFAPKGDKNGRWRGGIYPKNEAIRKSKEYDLWREAVLKRDNFTCIWCGFKGKQLDVDHIKPFCDYPELRFAIDNGRTLCRECHKTTDTYGQLQTQPTR